MTIRQTSIDVYTKIKSEGLLSRMRWLAYEALYLNGPLTGKELDQLLGTDSAHKRLSELKTLGVIDDSGERIRACRISGENVIEWDVTTNLPIKGESAPKGTGDRPTDSDIDKAVADLRELWQLGQAAGLAPSPSLVNVARWLARGAP